MGPDSTAWSRDKIRSAVRKVFHDTFVAIAADFREKSATDSNSNSPISSNNSSRESLVDDEDDKSLPRVVLDPHDLAALVEDELFDYLADGEKGRLRICGDRVSFIHLSIPNDDTNRSICSIKQNIGLYNSTLKIRKTPHSDVSS